MRVFTFALIASLTFLSGCASLRPSDVVQPSEVTLDNALKSVGNGLKEMLEARGSQPFGLVPAEVEVKFRIAANAKDQSKLVVDLSRSVTPETVKKDMKVGGEVSQSSEGVRDNTITIKFINVLTIPEKTLAYDKPDKIKTVLDATAGTIQLLTTSPQK